MGICEYLQSCHIPFRAFLHQPEPSATRRARSVHVPGRRVAKAVLVKAGGGYVLAVLPATHRIDFARLAIVLKVPEARLAGEDEVGRVFSDCERGALPPFGSLYQVPTLVDESLAEDEQIVFESQSHEEAIRMAYRDYEALEHPRTGRFALTV